MSKTGFNVKLYFTFATQPNTPKVQVWARLSDGTNTEMYFYKTYYQEPLRMSTPIITNYSGIMLAFFASLLCLKECRYNV